MAVSLYGLPKKKNAQNNTAQNNVIQNSTPQNQVQNTAPVVAQQTSGTGIREALKSTYGIGNNDIGFSDGWVTVKGQNLIKPDWISDEGTSYVKDASSLQKAVSDFYSNGDVGIRANADKYGLDSSKFGYSNGKVTYDGQDFATPSKVENGVSYTSGQDMLGSVLNYYKNNGKNVVKVTDYAANSPYPLSVSYNNGMVSINGQTIKPLFVENGSAYIDSSVLDGAISAAQKQSGIQARNAIIEKYSEQYQPYYDKLLNAITNRKEFSYDVASDPVFASYKEQYNREGDRTMRDALGSYSGLTGGYANSAALTAAAQQRQYWGDKLMDRIPELEQQAHNRYVSDFDMNRSALSSVMGLDNQQFNREYGANSDMINDVIYNNEFKRQRENEAYERAWNEEERNYNRRLDGELDPLTVLSTNHEVYKQGLANQSAEFSELLNRSILSGDWTDYNLARKFGIDPENVKPRDYEVWQMNKELESEAASLALKNSYKSSSGNPGNKVRQTDKTQQSDYEKDLAKRIADVVKAINIDWANDGYGTENIINQNSSGEYALARRSATDYIISRVNASEKLNDDEKLALLNSIGISDASIINYSNDSHYK